MMKKRIFLILTALFLFLFSSCGKDEAVYEPRFTLSEGFALENDRIFGTVIGAMEIHIFEFLDTTETITVFSDTSGSQYVDAQSGWIPLENGENHLILVLSNGSAEKEYYLDITCVEIHSLDITILNESRTYRIGEAFDKSTISVTAKTKAGETIEISHYIPEYEFSELGEASVGIELGGMYESFSVMVTEEYRPMLDSAYQADGVSYMLENGEVTLTDAGDAEGFFAVPSSVIIEEREYPVRSIGVLAFEGASVTKVLIPEGVRTIENEAFASCRVLEELVLPETLEDIASFAFSGCSSLSSITLPNGLTSLSDGVFRNCSSLVHITLPDGLELIGKRAFYACESLSSVDFPTSIHTIEESAFHGCQKLSTVIVGNLDFLGDEAFSSCPSLKVFAVSDVKDAGFDIFLDSENVLVYCKNASSFAFKMKIWKIETKTLKTGELYAISVPETFAIGDRFPRSEVFILALSEDGMQRFDDYDPVYEQDACGMLSVTLASTDFSYTFNVFVSYIEELAIDTDSRGAVYQVNVSEKTATLVSVPEWVKKSRVYTPETNGLFIVPTAVLRGSELYTVTKIEEDAFDICENIETVFVPNLNEINSLNME